jgi:hypothetical protein
MFPATAGSAAHAGDLPCGQRAGSGIVANPCSNAIATPFDTSFSAEARMDAVRERLGQKARHPDTQRCYAVEPKRAKGAQVKGAAGPQECFLLL